MQLAALEQNIKIVSERLRLYKEEDKFVEPEIINHVDHDAVANPHRGHTMRPRGL